MAESIKASLTVLDLDKINIEERIGRGNFSVFKARTSGKVMAVKKMDCDKRAIPREVEVHSSLPPHPNIIQLLGITHTPDGFTIYICMELANKSLYKYLHTERETPSLEKSMKFAKQIAMGMEHLHRHGLAHQDLKSANVLLFEREDILKLCDFGSARVLERTATMSGNTGTYRWMAPEFNDTASTKINKRCDVFSYGMILFEIFVHKIPFSDIKEAHDVLPLIQNKERPLIPPEMEVPSHIKDLIDSCWKHDAHDRPTSEKILQMFATFPLPEKKPQVIPSLPYFDVNDVILEERIYQGYTTVYQGRVAGQKVAVKKMECNKMEVPHEVRINVSLLPHPNIVQLLGVAHSQDGFTIYICMELSDKSLRDYLYKEKKKPSLQQSTKWAMQIASGMHHIHQHGLAHCALMSRNLLLFEKEDILKIGAFYSAQALECTTTVTETRPVATLPWIAPEFYHTLTTRINQRCDVFSYGMVLYEIFAHELPFCDIFGDTIELLTALHDGKRPPIPSEVPMYIKQLMKSCWKHNPHDRPMFKDILQILAAKGTPPSTNKTPLEMPNDGWMPLHAAAESGDVETLQQLIGAQVNANAQTVKEGKTALHIASKHGHIEFIRVLISIAAYVNINQQDKDGRTALYCASWKGQTAIVQLLIKEKADVSICKENGASPLYVASQEGHTEVVDILLKSGADPNLSTKNTSSVPLGIAAENGHTEIVKRLLEGGANSDYQNKFGKTALYYATWKKHMEVASLLVCDHADDRICNEEAD